MVKQDQMRDKKFKCQCSDGGEMTRWRGTVRYGKLLDPPGRRAHCTRYGYGIWYSITNCKTPPTTTAKGIDAHSTKESYSNAYCSLREGFFLEILTWGFSSSCVHEQ